MACKRSSVRFRLAPPTLQDQSPLQRQQKPPHQKRHFPFEALAWHANESLFEAERHAAVGGGEDGSGPDGEFFLRKIWSKIGDWPFDQAEHEFMLVRVPVRHRAAIGHPIAEQGMPQCGVVSGKSQLREGQRVEDFRRSSDAAYRRPQKLVQTAQGV